jgi:hypothetical protein
MADKTKDKDKNKKPKPIDKDLEKELEKQEQKYGKGRFEIDKKYRRVKRKGYRCLTMDELRQEGQDLWKNKLKIK